MSAVTERISKRLAGRGIDLTACTSVGAYNGAVDHAYRLPGSDDATALVVGNTAALWRHVDGFVLAAGTHVEDPVDEFVVGAVRAATADVDRVVDIRFAHDPPPRRIAIQRLAHLAGLAWLSPSHLCVHSEFGPWIALRAAIVLDEPLDTEPPGPPEPTCDCSRHCLPLLAQALEAGEPADGAELAERWLLWVAVRDACPVGRGHRYPDEQIRYHYTGARLARWDRLGYHSEV